MCEISHNTNKTGEWCLAQKNAEKRQNFLQVGSTPFGSKKIRSMIRLLVTRKERGNSVHKYISRKLKRNGSCLYSTWSQSTRSEVGFYAIEDARKNQYSLYLFGADAITFLKRLNEPKLHIQSIEAFRGKRKIRKEIREQDGYKKPVRVKQSRSIAGDNGRLSRHFQQTSITWKDAVAIIVKVTRQPRWKVDSRLKKSIDERSVAILWVSKKFVFRLNIKELFTVPSFAQENLGADVEVKIFTVNNDTKVEFYSTKDNADKKMYRRLRRVFKQHFDCMPRSRTIARERHLHVKQLLRFAC